MAVEKNITKAKELYHYTCDELGFPDSCFALGNLYLTQKSKDTCTMKQAFSQSEKLKSGHPIDFFPS